ncbi:MAG: EAL domain-containing protein [Candidatus Izemoplasma sp.]|nr:EAL domain-containing protein [Candidatus Izemoplasma sp.]
MKNNRGINQLKKTITNEQSIIEIDDINGIVKIIFSDQYQNNNKTVQNVLSFDIDVFNDDVLENEEKITDIIINYQNKNIVKPINFKHKNFKKYSFYINNVISQDRITMLIGFFLLEKERLLHAINLLQKIPFGLAILKMNYSKDNILYDYEFSYANEEARLFFDKDDMSLRNKKGSQLGHQDHKRILKLMKNKILKKNKTKHSFYVKNVLNHTSHQMILKRLEKDLILLTIINITELDMRINQLKNKNLYDKHTGLPRIEMFDLAKNKQSQGIIFFVSISNYEQVKVFNKQKSIIKEKENIIKNLKQITTKKGDIYLNNERSFVLIFNKLDNYEHYFKRLADFKNKTETENTLGLSLTIGYGIVDEHSDYETAMKVAKESSYFAEINEINEIIQISKEQYQQMLENHKLKNKLHQAIIECKIDIYFQKIFDINQQQFKYIEALSRWDDLELGFVHPKVFFDIADKFNFMDKLDKLIIKKSIENYKLVRETITNPIKLALNLSTHALKDKSIVQFILNLLEENEIKREDIVIEISEKVFIEDVDIIKIIKRIHKYFSIAIDDFGSIYTSISLLQDVPFDILKLDGIFVDKVHDELTLDILKPIIEETLSKDKTVIIEKIETIRDSELFYELGVSLQQGYLHHRPTKMI